MRIDRGFLGWGVFLILLGGIPLAVNQGWLDASLVSRAWELWPLILVGIGISMLLRRTALEGLGGLVVAGTFGIMLGSLFVGGFGIPFSAGGCGIGDGDGVAFQARDGSLGDTARVSIELDCGEVRVDTASGSGWTVAGRDSEGQGPIIDASNSALRVASNDSGPFLGDHDSWDVTVPTDPALTLELRINAGSGDVNLDGARTPSVGVHVNAGDAVVRLDGTAEVERLEVDVNAGAAHVTLPDASLRGSVSANAGSVELCRSADTAIRIVTDTNIAASYDLRGLVDTGSGWESPGFDDADTRVELDASANAGSISLDPEDGCNG